jgi:GNAT superfamily N-acetyltransferase
LLNVLFRQPDSYSDIRLLRDFLTRQNLGYPNYDDWVFRATEEIDQGYKQTVLAFDDGKLVGDVIFQPHKEVSGLREIKNLRVDEESRFRKFGSFLLRQAEFIDHDQYDWLIADFREEQKAVERLLMSEGYIKHQIQCLYDDHLDIVAMKQSIFREKDDARTRVL